jgi:hypothetical protein
MKRQVVDQHAGKSRFPRWRNRLFLKKRYNMFGKMKKSLAFSRKAALKLTRQVS